MNFFVNTAFLFCEKKSFIKEIYFYFFEKFFSGCFFSEVFLKIRFFLLQERFFLKSGF